MVEGVHSGRGDAPVRQQGIPPLPDGRRAKTDLVDPARILFIEEEVISQIAASDGGQFLSKDRKADKAGPEQSPVFFQERDQALRASCGIRSKMMPQGQQVSCLCIRNAPAVCGIIFSHDIGTDLRRPCRVFLFFRSFAQHSRSLCHKFRTVHVIDRSNESVLGSAFYAVHAPDAVKGEPIAVMETVPPAVIVPVNGGNIVHPVLHALELLGQNLLIPVGFIQMPGNDRCCVAPGAGTAVQPEGGNHIRNHSARPRLLTGHIMEEFSVKCVGVRHQNGSRREDLGVSRPSHPLIPLGAVGRHVDEVVLHAPFRVQDQAVDQLISSLYAAGPRHFAGKGKARKITLFQIIDSFHLHIAVSVEGEFRFDDGLFPARNIDVFRFCGPQVFIVEIPLLQDLSCLQADLRACGLMYTEPEDACDILSEVKDLLARGRSDQFCRLKFFAYCHGQGIPGRQLSFRRLAELRRLRGCFRQGIIPVFAVIDIGESDIPSCQGPALIRADITHAAVLIDAADLRDQLAAVPVIPFSGQVIEAEPAGVPAVAQLHAQKAALLKLLRQVISLVLQPGIIVIAVGSQMLIPDFSAIQPRFIETKPADIESCALKLLLAFNHF